MKVSDLGIIAINEAPPPLDLTPEEVAALAEELVHDHAAFVVRYVHAAILTVARERCEEALRANHADREVHHETDHRRTRSVSLPTCHP